MAGPEPVEDKRPRKKKGSAATVASVLNLQRTEEHAQRYAQLKSAREEAAAALERHLRAERLSKAVSDLKELGPEAIAALRIEVPELVARLAAVLNRAAAAGGSCGGAVSTAAEPVSQQQQQ
ncbi:hypothetical protein ABPG75_004357 [Micractinium tetrahymenae]